MTEGIWERDEYETDGELLDPEDTLDDGDDADPMLEQGYSPPERPQGLDAFGTTAAEERAGEGLDRRLAQEVPDPNLAADLGADPAADDASDESGTARAGRLIAPDEGAHPDTESELSATDVGIDGAGASAEEAAMHVIDPDPR